MLENSFIIIIVMIKVGYHKKALTYEFFSRLFVSLFEIKLNGKIAHFFRLWNCKFAFVCVCVSEYTYTLICCCVVWMKNPIFTRIFSRLFCMVNKHTGFTPLLTFIILVCYVCVFGTTLFQTQTHWWLTDCYFCIHKFFFLFIQLHPFI